MPPNKKAPQTKREENAARGGEITSVKTRPTGRPESEAVDITDLPVGKANKIENQAAAAGRALSDAEFTAGTRRFLEPAIREEADKLAPTLQQTTPQEARAAVGNPENKSFAEQQIIDTLAPPPLQPGNNLLPKKIQTAAQLFIQAKNLVSTKEPLQITNARDVSKAGIAQADLDIKNFAAGFDIPSNDIQASINQAVIGLAEMKKQTQGIGATNLRYAATQGIEVQQSIFEQEKAIAQLQRDFDQARLTRAAASLGFSNQK